LPIDATGVLTFGNQQTARPYQAYRPANVKLNGVLWGPSAVAYNAAAIFTWSNRNRTLETSQILAWTDATVPLEDGWTIRIDLFDGAVDIDVGFGQHPATPRLSKMTIDTTVTFTYAELVSVLQSTNTNISWAIFAWRADGENGGRSLCKVIGGFTLELAPTTGYGLNYGLAYG
jgi:hypothetical protein